MSLKLFRSTGYSSILAAGESRLATHPSWLIVAVSLWIGLACNVGLWREIRSLAGGPGLGPSLLAGALLSGACGAVLNLFGWRRTLKKAATLLLLLAALVSSCIWVQQLPLDSTLLDLGLRGRVFPSWPSLLRWQFPAMLAGLGLLPMLWVWQLKVRRLPGPEQFSANLTGVLVGLGVMGASAGLLARGV